MTGAYYLTWDNHTTPLVRAGEDADAALEAATLEVGTGGTTGARGLPARGQVLVSVDSGAEDSEDWTVVILQRTFVD